MSLAAFSVSALSVVRLQYPQALPWVVLLLTGLILATLFLYPAQLRQLPRGLRWLAPTLRLLAISAIGFSILRPVVARPRVASERAPIVILLDDSASMSVVDFNRPPAEWVGIAAAMEKLPPNARDKELDAVQGDCDRLSSDADDVIRARAGLDYAKLSGRGLEAAQSRLDQSIGDVQSTAKEAANLSASMKAGSLDRTLALLSQFPTGAGADREGWLDRVRERARAAAMSAEQARVVSDGELFHFDQRVREACQPLQSLSRLQLSELMVLDPANGLLARLGRETPVLGFGISDRVIPIDLSQPQSTTQPLAAEGEVSNLTGGIRVVLESLKGDEPRGLVLFTDGRLNAADLDAATMAAIQGIPIFTIGAATRAGLKDLSITSVNVPSTATIGETVTLTAELRAFGLHGVTSKLTITGGGSEETRSINFPDDRPINVSFNRRFTSAGVQRLSLEISPIPGELTTDNNKIERWISVFDTPPKTPVALHPATRPAIEAEMGDLTGDEGFLRRLSESSGGQFFRLDQVDLLPKRLNEIHEDATHPIEIPLWDGPFLYVLVLGSLTAEWGLRKRYGLV